MGREGGDLRKDGGGHRTESTLRTETRKVLRFYVLLSLFEVSLCVKMANMQGANRRTAFWVGGVQKYLVHKLVKSTAGYRPSLEKRGMLSTETGHTIYQYPTE